MIFALVGAYLLFLRQELRRRMDAGTLPSQQLRACRRRTVPPVLRVATKTAGSYTTVFSVDDHHGAITTESRRPVRTDVG